MEGHRRRQIRAPSARLVSFWTGALGSSRRGAAPELVGHDDIGERRGTSLAQLGWVHRLRKEGRTEEEREACPSSGDRRVHAWAN